MSKVADNSRAGFAAGLRVLLTLASFVVIVSGLKLAKTLLTPLVIAFFLANLSKPVADFLRRHHVPGFFSFLITFLLNAFVVSAAVLILIQVVSQFQSVSDTYVYKTRIVVVSVLKWLESIGFENAESFFESVWEWEAVIRFVRDSAIVGGLIGFMKNLVVIILVMLFMLTSSSSEGRNLKKELSGTSGRLPNFSGLANASRDIQRYLVIKTFVSALTGVLASVVIWTFNEDFPILWGFLAFAFNFIPAIGSIIAAIPPIIVAFINGIPSLQNVAQNPDIINFDFFLTPGTFYGAFPVVEINRIIDIIPLQTASIDWSSIDMSSALGILLGYLVINILIGNFLEPVLLGYRFGLTSLVVIISVIFWGWVWGAVGMFLSVPLTIMVKVLFDNTRDLKWLSLIMEKPKRRRQFLSETGAKTT